MASRIHMRWKESNVILPPKHFNKQLDRRWLKREQEDQVRIRAGESGGEIQPILFRAKLCESGADAEARDSKCETGVK